MKSRPILFSGPMVRALLDGTKTQTRRIVKPQPIKSSGTHRGYPLALMANDWAWPHPGTSGATTISNRPNGPLGWEIHCPYGQPGDRLWVRERFTPLPMQAPTENPSRWQILYAAGGAEEREAPAGYNPMLYNYERWLCPILAASFRGEAKEWIEHDDGRTECTAFVPMGYVVPQRCSATQDMFGESP